MPNCCSGCRWRRAGRGPLAGAAGTCRAWPITPAMPEPGAPGARTVPGIRRDGTVLGFDVGARRIGVAVGSAFGHGARALAVVDVHAQGPDWAAIDQL